MAVDLRPNLHYTAELNGRVGFIIAVKTDEKDRASYLVEMADGSNTVMPAGRETILTSHRTVGEAWEEAGFESDEDQRFME